MNNEDFMIEQESIALAQRICNDIKDVAIRNRAMANVVAIQIAKEYFDESHIAVDVNSSICNLSQILSGLDVSDIYVNGNYVDVRVYFNDNELCVPKAHFDYEMAPVAYMFIKLDESLTSGQVTGFVLSDDITGEHEYDGYYAIPEDLLKSYYDVEEMLSTATDSGIDSEFKKKAMDFLDGKSIDLGDFYKELISSESARTFISGAIKTQAVMNLLEFESGAESEEAIDSVIETPEETPEALETVDDFSLNDTEEILGLEESDDFGDIVPLEAEDIDELEDLNNGDDGLIAQDESLQEQEPEDNTEVLETSDNELQPVIEENEDELLQEASDIEALEPIVQDETTDLPIDNQTEMPEDLPEETVDTSIYEEIPAAEENISDDVISEAAENDEINELSKFDYSTEIIPSMASIEGDNAEGEVEEELTEELLNASGDSSAVSGYNEPVYEQPNAEQINDLFPKENSHVVKTGPKKKKSPLPVIGLLVVLAAAGYFGYTKYFAPEETLNTPPNTAIKAEDDTVKTSPKEPKKEPKKDAMPNETVENVAVPKKTEEGNSVSIPAIEQNLNASIQVSNLTVTWEVPSAYVNNATAKRYLVKMGKVLQLNLKTELLMMSKSPINNKVLLELELNKATNKFKIKRFVESSGVFAIDEIINDTVNRTLDMNMNMNTSVFNNLQGDPVLIIKL